MTIARVGFVAMMALTPLACGSSLNGPDGGTGGTVGTGTAGAVGTGGAAGGTTSTAPPPTCLRDLIGSCRLTSACQYALADGSGSFEFCYSNGLKAIKTNGVGTPTAPGWVSNIYKADGTLCYSEEVHCGGFCESHYVVWKNAAGDMVATAQLDASFVGASGQVEAQSKVTCVATDETCLAPIGDYNSCLPAMPDENRCMQGTCP